MSCKQEPVGMAGVRYIYRPDVLPVTQQQCQSTQNSIRIKHAKCVYNCSKQINQSLKANLLELVFIDAI